MEQDKSPVPDLSDEKGQGGEVTAGEMAVEEDPPHRDALPEQEDASAAGSGGHGDAAAESDEEEVLEVIFDSEALVGGSEGVAAVGNAGRGAASGSAKNEDLEVPKNPLATRFRFRVAIAHPTPPTTYRRLPLRSRKQYNPTHFIAAGAAPAATRSAGDSAMSTTDQGAMNEAQGSTVTFSELDAMVDKSSSDESKSGTDATNAAVSSSAYTWYGPPSRSRKKRRPDHFIPEEAEASARAKARRSNNVLDRFVTSMLRVSPGQRPEWVRNVTADDDRGQGRLEEGPEEPDGRARILTVLAVLGASMALCVISCVLFYIIGKRTEHGRHKVSDSLSKSDAQRLVIWPAAKPRFNVQQWIAV